MSLDWVYPQMFVISLLNILSFIYVHRIFDFKKFFSELKFKNHFISYLLFIIIASLSLIVTENFIEGIVSLIKLYNLFIAFCLIIIIASSNQLKFLNYFIIVTLLSLFIESVIINILVIDSVIINGNLLGRSNDYAGFGANINIASFSVLIKSMVPIYLIFNNKNKVVRALSFIFIYSSFLTILLLMSRAAILSLFLVFVFLFGITVFSKKINII